MFYVSKHVTSPTRSALGIAGRFASPRVKQGFLEFVALQQDQMIDKVNNIKQPAMGVYHLLTKSGISSRGARLLTVRMALPGALTHVDRGRMAAMSSAGPFSPTASKRLRISTLARWDMLGDAGTTVVPPGFSKFSNCSQGNGICGKHPRRTCAFNYLYGDAC